MSVPTSPPPRHLLGAKICGSVEFVAFNAHTQTTLHFEAFCMISNCLSSMKKELSRLQADDVNADRLLNDTCDIEVVGV